MEGVIYKTKVVDFHGKERRILYPNAGGDCRCPIVALGNALSLRGDIEFPSEMVRQQQLVLLIYQFLMQSKKGLSPDDKEVLLASIKRLIQPISISLNFTRVDGIHSSDVQTMFEDVGISLFHVWVVDPENASVANAVGPDFHDICNAGGPAVATNPLGNAGELVQNFLNGTGLTTNGLQLLKQYKVQQEGVICLLFWSSSLHTMLLKDGHLFVLQNEPWFLSGTILWRELNNLRSGDTFWDSNFRLCPSQNVLPSFGNQSCHKFHKKKCSIEFSAEFNQKRHMQLHVQKVKTVKDNLDRSKVGIFWDGLAYEDSFNILSLNNTELEVGLTGPFIVRMLRIKLPIAERHYASTTEDILNIITGSVIKVTSKELFDLLDECSEFTFLQTDPCEKFDSGLDTRGIISSLPNLLAYCAFIIEKKMVRKLYNQMEVEAILQQDLLMKEEEEKKQKYSKGDNLLKCTRYLTSKELENKASSGKEENPSEISKSNEGNKDCLGQSAQDHTDEHPSPRDCTSFVEFVRKNNLIKAFKLRPKRLFKKLKKIFTDFKLSFNVLTYAGRRCARGYMKCIIMAHRAGKSWNGIWNTSDMKVKDGLFYISKEPLFQLTVDHMVEDFKRYTELLFPYYRSNRIPEHPFYFNQLMEDILKVPDPIREPDKLDLFQKYMALHWAFMPPVSRSTLVEQLYKACESLIMKPDTTFMPLLNGNVGEWRTYLQTTPLFKDVYYYQGRAPYDASSWGLLTFSRHFIAHVRDHTKENGVQLIQDVSIINLILAQLLGCHLTKLMLEIVYCCKMDGVFYGIWRTFEASDGEVDLFKENDEDDVSEESDNQQDTSSNDPGDNA